MSLIIANLGLSNCHRVTRLAMCLLLLASITFRSSGSTTVDWVDEAKAKKVENPDVWAHYVHGFLPNQASCTLT